MKKIGLMFMLAGVIAFGFSSCKDDDDNPDNPGTPAKPKPTVELISGANLTTASGDIDAGDSVNFKIHVTGENNLEMLQILISTNGSAESIYAQKDISGDKVKTYDWLSTYYMPNLPNTSVKFTFKATMKDGDPGTHTITLKTKAAAKNFQSRDNIDVGAQNNATYGSFLNMSLIQAIMLADANANPETIDIVYYYGVSNKGTLASPDDPTSASVFASVASWSKRKQTRFFKTAFTAAEFDAMTTTAQVDALLPNATAKLAADLQVGNVVLYVTEGGTTYGLIKIDSYPSATASGSVVIDVKTP